MLTKENIIKTDTSNMKDSIENMSCQIEESLDIIDSFEGFDDYVFNNIIICGMGGSAIGGDFVSNALTKEISIPIYINRSYNLPKWINNKTLVILSSYSGNTEETISCLNEALNQNIIPLIISGGGFLLEKAINNSFPYIKLVQGIQPRAAFGYSSSLLLLALIKINILDASYIKIIKDSIYSLKKMSKELSCVDSNNKAIKFAYKIYGKYPIIYGTPSTQITSLRFRGQLAENAKILSSHHILPEQNHNEIEGFINSTIKDKIIIWIKDVEEHERIEKRIHFTSAILNNYTDNLYYTQEGNHLIVRMYKSIHFFDWVSYYLSIMYKTDPTPVQNIKKLKELMSS